MEMLINGKIMDFITELLILSSLNNEYYDDINILEITSTYLSETNIILGNKFDEEMYKYIKTCKGLIDRFAISGNKDIEMYNIFNRKIINKVIYDNSINMIEVCDGDSYKAKLMEIESSIEEYFSSIPSKNVSVNRDDLDDILNFLVDMTNHVYNISKELVIWSNDKNKYLWDSGKIRIKEISTNNISSIYFIMKLYVSMFKICSKLFTLFINKIEYQLK